MPSAPPGGFVTVHIPIQFSCWSLSICVPNKLPGDADSAGPGTTFGVIRLLSSFRAHQLHPLIPLYPPMCVCYVAKSCPALCDPMDCSPPDSSVHGIFQARILEWVAISFSRGSSWTRDRTCVSCVPCIGRWIIYHSAPWEAPSPTFKCQKCTLIIQLEKRLNTDGVTVSVINSFTGCND